MPCSLVRSLARSLSLSLCAAAALAACVDDPTLGDNRAAPSWEEFRASVLQLEDGSLIVNGDEPVLDEAELRAFYDRVHGGGELIVNQVGGNDDRWSDTQKLALTYCVSNGFKNRKAQVVSAMAAAAALWENAADVDFVYLSAHDASCTTANNNVVFSVEPTGNGSIYARAFFPSYPKSQRNVLVNARLTFNGDYPPANILGHELGHTLGFRHEHTRPEAGTCFEDNQWRPLTPYDASSIMHYPSCNGGPGALTFSALDASGAAALYGP